jgi:hypothetical protein
MENKDSQTAPIESYLEPDESSLRVLTTYP